MMKKFKLIVAGGREFSDSDLLKEKLDFYLANTNDTEVEIVCGKASEADTLGEKYAIENGLKVKAFPLYEDIYGKSAGYRRNTQMAEYGDALIAFWDGKSRGTKMMIDMARKKGLPLRVIQY